MEIEKEKDHQSRYHVAASDFVSLLEILQKLRSPEGGCPWDRRQEKKDIGRYVIEEAYELIDAVENGDPAHQSEELGDLFFQILFLAKISEEKAEFDITHVLKGIAAKMIRRHPHVFAGTKIDSVQDVKTNWDRIKREVEHKGESDSILSGVPKAFPALTRAQTITQKAAAVGFDWPDIDGVLEKVEEELSELKTALTSKDKKAITAEIGDLLFSVVNLSRFAGVNAEEALRGTVEKFIKRFSHIELKLKAARRSLESATLEEMDNLWEEAKRSE